MDHMNKNTFSVVTPSIHGSYEQEHHVCCGYAFDPWIMWTRTLLSLWACLRSIDHVNKNTSFNTDGSSIHRSYEQEHRVCCGYNFVPLIMSTRNCVQYGWTFDPGIMWTRTLRSLWLRLQSMDHMNKNTSFVVVTPSFHWLCQQEIAFNTDGSSIHGSYEQEHYVRCGYVLDPWIMWTRTLLSLWLRLRPIDRMNRNTLCSADAPSIHG
jgi:hypothetical protein